MGGGAAPLSGPCVSPLPSAYRPAAPQTLKGGEWRPRSPRESASERASERFANGKGGVGGRAGKGEGAES